jgi:hypothetical protein
MLILDRFEKIHSTLLHKNQDHVENDLLVQAALRNLSSADNKIININYNINLSPRFTLKDRCSILKKTLETHTSSLKNILIYTAALVGVVALSVLLFRFVNWHLGKLKEAIANGTAWVHETFYTRPAFMADWLLEAIELYSFAGGLSLIGAAIPLTGLYHEIDLFRLSYQFHAQLKKVDTERMTFNIELDPAEIANEQTAEGHFVDPLSGRVIDQTHINHANLIKVGSHLIKVESLIKEIFKHDLSSGMIKHPLFDRYLFDQEQSEVLERLSRLLAISQENILQSFNIFQDVNFKIVMSHEEKAAYETSILRRYKQQLMAEEVFRMLPAQDQDHFIAEHKNEAFHKVKLNNLNQKLDQRIKDILTRLDL